MYIVGVKFGNCTGKLYWYKTTVSMQVGKPYKICSNRRDYYSDSVWVYYCYENPKLFKERENLDPSDLVMITKARPATDNPTPESRIKLVKFDESKGVTVVRWTDNTVTKVTCSEKDEFDKEKALALCYMKRWCFDNRSCFNNIFKKYGKEETNGN